MTSSTSRNRLKAISTILDRASLARSSTEGKSCFASCTNSGWCAVSAIGENARTATSNFIRSWGYQKISWVTNRALIGSKAWEAVSDTANITSATLTSIIQTKSTFTLWAKIISCAAQAVCNIALEASLLIRRKSETSKTGSTDIVGWASSAVIDSTAYASSCGTNGKIVLTILAEIVGDAICALLDVAAYANCSIVGWISGLASCAIICCLAKCAATDAALNTSSWESSKWCSTEVAVVRSITIEAVHKITCLTITSEGGDWEVSSALWAKVGRGALKTVSDIALEALISAWIDNVSCRAFEAWCGGTKSTSDIKVCATCKILGACQGDYKSENSHLEKR